MLEKTRKGVNGWWRFPKSWVNDGFLSMENATAFRLLLFIVSSVNYCQCDYFGEKLQPGEMIYTWVAANRALGESRQKIRTAENALIKMGYIERRSNNHYSIIRLLDYSFFQGNQQQQPQGQEMGQKEEDYKEDTPVVENKKREKKPLAWEPEIKEVMRYFVEVTGKPRAWDCKTTVKALTARFNDKHTVDQCKQVIDFVNVRWTEQYIDPKNVFSSKFPSYLEQSKDKPRQLAFTDVPASQEEQEREIKERFERESNNPYFTGLLEEVKKHREKGWISLVELMGAPPAVKLLGWMKEYRREEWEKEKELMGKEKEGKK